MPHTLFLLPIAALSGAGFALIGIAYRIGQSRHILPTHIMTVISCGGSMFFLSRIMSHPQQSVPLIIFLMGAFCGISNYFLVKLVTIGLRMGPLSPVWCAMALSFLPAVIYAAAFLGERLGLLQLLSLASAVGCVLVASLGQKSDPRKSELRSIRSILMYAGCLLAILIVSGAAFLSIKHLESIPSEFGKTYIDLYGAYFFLALYASLAISLLIEVLSRRRFQVPLGKTLILGIFGMLGSLTGMLGTQAASQLPAAVAFTLSGVTSILVAALVSVLFLGEKANKNWYATVALGILAVVLINAESIIALL